MPVIHSFLIKYSLRTGAIVGLILSWIMLVVYLILGFIIENVLNIRVIGLFGLWFLFTAVACYGVYERISILLIPELSRRVLFAMLNIMGITLSLFQDESQGHLTQAADIGLQWYIIANASDLLYYILAVTFIVIIFPFKVYLFVILLCYYLQLRADHHDIPSEE